MATLRDRLQLTPEQLVAWSRYVEAVDAYAKHFYEERPAAAFVSEPAPRQVGRMVDSLQNRLALLEQMEDSAKAVYATLSPEQQKTANQFWLASIPVFASSAAASCPSNTDRKSRPDGERPNRRGGGMGGPMGM